MRQTFLIGMILSAIVFAQDASTAAQTPQAPANTTPTTLAAVPQAAPQAAPNTAPTILAAAPQPAPVPAPAAPQGKKSKKKAKTPQPSALDLYIKEASVPQASNGYVAENGSLWSPAARFSNLAADLRARNVDDIVTIVVSENASAVSTGQSKTSRASAASASVTSLAGPKSPTGGLANLLNTTGNQSLDGEGTTSRSTTLTTVVSARVTHVLVNGNLVIEGTRHLNVNSENQVITIRGVIRPIDLDTTNSVASQRIAQMEIQVDGKGIVNDAVKRPFILYRLLLGLLPF